MNAITLMDVTHSYGARVVVDRLSLTVETGEIVALVGQTGAGKSTVLNMIMGNFAPDTGSIDVAGFDPHREAVSLRGKIGVSFQTDRLLPWRTASQNVEIGLQILGYDVAARRARATMWLERVKLGDAGTKYPHELSGGMRQRVSLARALATNPEIVLLDESFSQLDHVTSKSLRADFREVMRTAGKTCVLITHRIDDAIEMADRIIVLRSPAAVNFEARPALADAAALHAQIEAAMHDVGVSAV